jgi:hypothetical protein
VRRQEIITFVLGDWESPELLRRGKEKNSKNYHYLDST